MSSSRIKRNRFVAGATVAGLIVTGAGAAKATSAIRRHNAEPGCEMEAYPLDNVTAMQHTIKSAGEDVSGDNATIWTNDHSRKRDLLHDPAVGGSVIVREGDYVDFPHVDPKICYNVGGKILGIVQKQK